MVEPEKMLNCTFVQYLEASAICARQQKVLVQISTKTVNKLVDKHLLDTP
jgi:hypothetical protein